MMSLNLLLFVRKTLGERSFSSPYAVKMTDLRCSMLYLVIEAGDAFSDEKSKLNSIGFTFNGA